ncbi:MAG: DUF1735 domain-containing protein [Bacteroidales bacterium]|nr:DUF1735 domain-containing protein [Bacteroidales bacterium]MCF8389567.1 DUF1735 domain-containing protein [Bacteroidales bacterium]
MKKRETIIKWTEVLLLLVLVSGCAYDDYREDYPYTSVYFTNQIIKRNFVEDEINTIKIGVMLGGKRMNTMEEWARFTIEDTAGLEATPYKLLPDKYYTLSSYNEMVIHSGTAMGEVSMEIDPSFFQDSLAFVNHYALVFKIEDASTDSILFMKDSLLLLVGFESRYFGNYYHNGLCIRKDMVNESIIDTIFYHQEEPVTNNINLWPLLTGGSKTVYSKGIGYFAPSNLTGFYIRVEDDYSLKISEDPDLKLKGYDWKIKQVDEENLYDPKKRMFILNYEFIDFLKGYYCYATDTLKFRNRILDGVNQWDL